MAPPQSPLRRMRLGVLMLTRRKSQIRASVLDRYAAAEATAAPVAPKDGIRSRSSRTVISRPAAHPERIQPGAPDAVEERGDHACDPFEHQPEHDDPGRGDRRVELRPVDRRDQEAGRGPQGKDDRRDRDAALPDRRPCLRNGLLARDARVRRIEHVRQREPWDLEQFCELRRDRVDTEHGRAGEEAEHDEVEPQVEERDDAADLRPQAVPAHPPTELVGGARHLAEEAASSQADPRGNERGDIGEQESTDECCVTAKPGDPQQAVRREKHQLLVDDDDVRATQVAAALGA